MPSRFSSSAYLTYLDKSGHMLAVESTRGYTASTTVLIPLLLDPLGCQLGKLWGGHCGQLWGCQLGQGRLADGASSGAANWASPEEANWAS